MGENTSAFAIKGQTDKNKSIQALSLKSYNYPMDIQAIIARIPAWKEARETVIERIAGVTNANYRITVDGERFVLRVSGANTAGLGIDRRCELAALQAAAAAGLAPEVVAFLPPEGHLVTKWVEGRHWDAPEFRTPQRVRLLTQTAQRIHALPSNGASFSPFRKVEAFLQAARDFDISFPQGIDGFLESMQTIENEQRRDPSTWLHFCHNDLVSVNYLFIEAGQGLKVLDWEFAGMGDIYYDLATIVYTHDNVGPIPPDLEDVMLESYFGDATHLQRRRLLGMKYMLMLFGGAWGLAQHGMQRRGLIPGTEGFDYEDFAHYLFAHDIPELQAQYEGVKLTITE
jgi:thiamine kinase-like enzyme